MDLYTKGLMFLYDRFGNLYIFLDFWVDYSFVVYRVQLECGEFLRRRFLTIDRTIKSSLLLLLTPYKLMNNANNNEYVHVEIFIKFLVCYNCPE